MLSRIAMTAARRCSEATARSLKMIACFSCKADIGVNHEALEADPKIPQTLKASDFLADRHIGPNSVEIAQMLKTLGVSTVQEFVEQTIPKSILQNEKYLQNPSSVISFPNPKTESLLLQSLKEVASKNKIFKSYIGCGFHPTILPSVIQRNVLENPVWYTSYTPYQAEISQGRLEALLHYQTMVSELTQLEVANCSLLDEATAAGEAMNMCFAMHEGKRKTFLVSKDVFPHILAVVSTKAKAMGVNLIVADPELFVVEDPTMPLTEANKDICGVLLQNPDNMGRVSDYTELIKKFKATGVHVAVAADLMSLAIMKPPGEMGADIALGTSQRFGTPMGYGGPHSGYFATRDEFKRKMPGRIIGISEDNQGNKCYRMALATREQHIKREKATSNICTAQALLADLTGFYGIYHGPKGLQDIATRIRSMALILQNVLKYFKYKLVTENEMIFDTVTIDLRGFKKTAPEMVEIFAKNGINIRQVDTQTISVSINEKTTLGDLYELIHVFDEVYGSIEPLEKIIKYEVKDVPAEIKRTTLIF